MKGDFSRWKYNPKDNFSGVLHQQGRVLLDRDWNDEERIDNHWQDQAGQDVIGPGVAAVPASESDSFQVQAAAVDTADRVELTVAPGRLWADGVLTYLTGEQPDPTEDVRRIATYLQSPIQDPPHDESGIGEGTRDAVILEVWREALNGFQMPAALIEPALGGPDTTERILTAMRFRLFRVAPEDTCANIGDRLKDDFSQKGKLTVSLQPTTNIGGDCPVSEGGGYVGFEHLLYRIEMAEVNGPPLGAMFKWSQFNGGLVGRGECDLSGPDKKITLTANDQAIKMSGLSNFYLEVLEEDLDQGYWRLTYGAEVVLNGDDLEVTTEHHSEGVLPSGRVFFRLWNGILPIADFPKENPPEPKELRDGIRLEFDAESGANYQPGDYWTFQVRAGEFQNLDPLIDDQPPGGVHYHRVPLAILNWDASRDITFADAEIEDCRHIVRPLTNQNVCCSFTVGDGRSSKGDFNSIEEAVRHLPASGGEICLLPGLHEANVIIKEKRNIKIKGCDKKSKIIPGKSDRQSPIFHVIDSQCITLEHMDMVTLGATTMILEGTELGRLKDVEVHYNRILACENAVVVKQGVGINIHYNKIRMLDKEGAGVAILIMAENSLIERNIIGVVPAERIPPVTPPGGEVPPDPTDPCADPERVYRDILFFILYVDKVWGLRITSFLKNPFKALGGIQIVGGSESIQVLENEISGGAGNGITLGGFLPPVQVDSEEGEGIDHEIEHRGNEIMGTVVLGEAALPDIVLKFEKIDGATNFSVKTETFGNGTFKTEPVEPGRYKVAILSPNFKIEDISTSASDVEFISHRIRVVEEEVDLSDLLAFLYEIQIDRNEISNMGLSGIGIPRVKVSAPTSGLGSAGLRRFRLMAPDLARFGNPVVDLSIYRNHIFNCLQNPFDREMRAEVMLKGLGGISLGMCEDLSIGENRIENNSTSHITPVCGIYVADGGYVNITHNQIANNGPLTPNTDAELAPGKRGGVVLTVSSFSRLDLITGQRFSVFNGKPAARVHDNVVDQPAGQTLRIDGLGPVSVVNNWFNSELSGREKLDLLAGAVLIYNLGGLHKTGATLGTNAAVFARSTQVVPLPNGNILFNSNQTRVGSANDSFTSQVIYSPDDIGFDGNQSENLKKGLLYSNTILFGGTLRASDNRFKEIKKKEDVVLMSLFTLTLLLNNTSNNQGDHCIIAINLHPGRPKVDTGNQVLIATSERCKSLELGFIEFFRKNPQFMGAII